MPNREWGGADLEHPILPEAWKYEVVALRLELDPLDAAEPYLDMTVRRGQDRRVLRFWSPRDLEIERGGPKFSSGMKIVDVRARGLEGIGVRVDDFEASHGSVRFCARTVESIDGRTE